MQWLVLEFDAMEEELVDQCFQTPFVTGGDVEMGKEVYRWSGCIFKNYLCDFIPFCNDEFLLTVVH